MTPTPEQIATFVLSLRRAICTLAEALPDAANYLQLHVGDKYARYADPFQYRACPLMDEFIYIGALLEPGAPPWPNERQRAAVSRGHTFVDDWPLADQAPLSRQLFLVDWCFCLLSEPPPLPADGQVFDEATRAAIARYREWRPGYDQRRLAEAEAIRAAREAAAPQHRDLPHHPDPNSLIMARDYAERDIASSTQVDDAHRSEVSSASLASSFLTRSLIDHWLLKDSAGIRADLDRAADLMASALPKARIHAWQYEQWQHIAVASGHARLMDALRSLGRADWDTNRIRPVNWLICRIRILDLLSGDGLDSEIRGLLEMSRIGLFDDPLPAELAVDTPLMQNWHHLLHAIVHREVATFDRCLAERQTLLAGHWGRGGGIAPVSLADLGGLALLRTGRQRGMAPAALDAPYLSLILV